MSKQIAILDDKAKLGQIYSNLIDIMFAIVLSQGFLFFSSNNGFFSWLRTGDSISIIDTLSIYLVVMGSWIRYHAVTQKFPREGNLRFVIDVFLLLLYYVGFVVVGQPLTASVIVFLTLSLYTVWSMLRVRENPESRNEPWTFGSQKNLLFTLSAAGVVITNLTASYFDIGQSGVATALLIFLLVFSYTIPPFLRNQRTTSIRPESDS